MITLKLVPYSLLSTAEKTKLHQWFDDHGLDHRRVPVDPKIHVDEDGYHVRVFKWLDGWKSFIGDDGEPATEWVHFQPKSTLPWRLIPSGDPEEKP
jgi:hypothetical protein